MSHIPQRKEKDCLNCGTVVQGNYCQNCGQENVVPHETFWHMVKHFLYDITHFDSKFFDSMRYLLLKPGFLPQEYMKGKRASYLNPIKKYVFTSAIFFIIFFGLLKGGDVITINIDKPLSAAQRANYIKRGNEELAKDPKNDLWRTAIKKINEDTAKMLTQNDMIKYWDDFNFINISGKKYKNREEYDSIQKIIPVSEKDNWWQRMIQRQNLKLREKYRNDPAAGAGFMVNTFLHKLPYLLFVSLPIFALLLKLLYIRRKQFYYADHGIFSIYHYVFSFILLLLVFGLDKLNNFTGWEVFDLLTGLVFMSGGIYLYLSMKRFYGQSHGKTIAKFILLNIFGLITLLFLFIVFLLLSVFQF